MKTWNWSLLHLFSSFQHFGYLLRFWKPNVDACSNGFQVFKKKLTFKFWKPAIEAFSIGFQVFNIFFTFKFWKPDIEACSIGFPVIGNKICSFGAPVRNKIVFALISKKCRKVTGFVSELASYYWGRWGNLKVTKFCLV